MSRFVDKLKQSAGGGKPMGFRAAAAKAAGPGMLLVALVARADAKDLAGAVAGADAGLLVAAKSGGAKAVEQASKAVPDIPWGVWWKEAGGEGAGADFIVFGAGRPLAVEGKVGKILEVEPSTEPSLLKAADELPVDAMLIAGESKPLTWGDLMLVQRCAGILSKPLLVSVAPEVGADELEALGRAGVRGVVVRAGAKGKIAAIAKILEKLPPPSAGKKAGGGPLLPRIGGETVTAAEEEEED